uniref:Defensin-like protein 4 n=2 Tax=Cajanus cajan TaxID=3821 RepID=A0A151S2H7_CAJCA|nr:Defensin-like protein 4 [Cajanus cajan]
MERKTFGLLFLVLLVLAADVAVERGEAAVCFARRHGFQGRCLVDAQCAHVCRSDGFIGGECRGPFRKCFCSRTC